MSNKLIKNETAVDRGKRIKFLRLKIAAMSGEVFAEHCQLSRGTITNWETGKGKTGLSEKGARQIVYAMQRIGIACTIAWLLNDDGDIPKIIDQSKLSRLHYPIAKNNPLNHVAESNYRQVESFLDEITFFKEKHTAHLLYTFEDESMEPIFHKNDCVGGPRFLPSQFKLLASNICIVLLQPDRLIVRKVRLEGAEMSLMSLYVINPEMMLEHPPMSCVPIDSIVALAPVTRVWRDLKNS